MPESLRIQEIAVPAILVLAIFLVALLVPALGAVVGVFSPVPLIYLYLRRGRETGLAGIMAVALALFVFLGLRYAVFFLAEYGILAAILSESIRLQLPVNWVIFLGTFATGLASGVLLFLAFYGEEISPGDFLREQVKGHLLQSLETLKGLQQGDKSLEGWDEKTIEILSGKLAISYPAFIFASCMFASLVNYAATGFLWRQLGGHRSYFTDRFSLWVLPEPAIWVFIFSGASVWFLDYGAFYAVALNVLIMSIVVYCLQGVAVAIYFLESKTIPVFLWVVLFAFVFTQPLLIGILIGTGVFDLWVDFRKLRPKTTPNSEGPEEEE